MPHFPFQGEIPNPTLNDYQTELTLIEDSARWSWPQGSPMDIMKSRRVIRWRALVRRLQWAKAIGAVS